MPEKTPIKISIVGAESTGKTTLAQNLAKQYQTVWVPEYGRIYAEGKVYLPTYSQWDSNEFMDIAIAQMKLVDQLVSRAQKYVFIDTDAFATSIWHRRYMNASSKEVEALAATSMADLYLVLSPDVAFVQDGTRDGEHISDWMHQEFINELNAKKQAYVVISGPYETRLEQAIMHLEKWQTQGTMHP